MTIYIASSWKNRHAVDMLAWHLRQAGHTVLSFTENCFGEHDIPFEDWLKTPQARQSFEYDTCAAMTSDLVIYLSPSGTDAWAEVGAAYASKVPIFGLLAKGEQVGLMRKMMTEWYSEHQDLLVAVNELSLNLNEATNGNN